MTMITADQVWEIIAGFVPCLLLATFLWASYTNWRD